MVGEGGGGGGGGGGGKGEGRWGVLCLVVGWFCFLPFLSFFFTFLSSPLVSVGVCQECVSEVCHERVRSVSGVCLECRV